MLLNIAKTLACTWSRLACELTSVIESNLEQSAHANLLISFYLIEGVDSKTWTACVSCLPETVRRCGAWPPEVVRASGECIW
jgi:hypothetical protein